MHVLPYLMWLQAMLTVVSLPVTIVNGQTAVNRAPVLASIGNKSVNEGSLLQFTLSATDADGDTLTYSAVNLPTGAIFQRIDSDLFLDAQLRAVRNL